MAFPCRRVVDVAAVLATGLATGLAIAACSRSGPAPTRAPSVIPAAVLPEATGSWRWLHRTDEPGTSRIEDEHWHLARSPSASADLVGYYVRDVEVRSTDRAPFACNQRPWYRQRAVFDVTVKVRGKELAIHETGYRTEPSPCDHGFRHLGDSTARLAGNRLVVHWAGGEQTLWQTAGGASADPVAPTEPPWPAVPGLAGPWHWESSALDDAGNVRDEAEQWEITRRADDRLEASYRRRVTVRTTDGSIIPCAGAPSWSFDDTYLLDGRREEEHWHFTELAVDPGDHACLRTTPTRNLDEATGEQLGDYLVLEWRGKRRQVLYRPQ